MPLMVILEEIRRIKKICIFDANGIALGEENDLLSALAFAHGTIEGNSIQNPFDSFVPSYTKVIINLQLDTVVNLMNAIRETSIMALSDYAATIDAYKRGQAAKQ
jgi:hypothetical protein